MAAKKITAAEIIIKTTDGGSFKVTGKEADKLTQKMKGLGGASQQTDRRIKGVTQQSSNATKNFSKQAQTMQGGIVGVYATIAAQAFAVSAAFQFLKSSMETRNLIEGQKAFGSVTGTAYKSLTSNIQDATNGMLSFKAAASSAAIGVAAGLSSSQLEGLGVAATNASLALGRDLEDSFNRLIRGVTKAEPELLDELGIILRLENATEKYALSVGKTREQLNAYERTQAVLNDVLDQAGDKYGKIQEKMDPDAFAMGQFSKEMDDLLLSFQEFVMKGIVPLLNFFKDNTGALVAAIGLFITPIIKSLLPNLNAALDTSMAKMKTRFADMKTYGNEAGNAFAGLDQAMNGGAMPTPGESKKGMQDLGIKSFKGKDKDTNAKILNKRQISAYRRMMREKKGIYMKFNRDEKRAFRFHLNAQEAMLKGHTIKQVAATQVMENVKQAAFKTTGVVYSAVLGGMQAATVGAAWAMNKAMMAAGLLGIFFMLIQAISALWQWFKDLDETAKKMRKETEDLTSKLTDLNGELEKMVDIRVNERLLDLKSSVEQAGQAFQSMDLVDNIRKYNKELEKGAKPGDEVIKQFANLAKNAAAFSPAFQEMADKMAAGITIEDETTKQYKRMTNEILNASEASKRFAQNQQTVNKMLDKQIRKFKDVPYKDLVDAYSSSVKDIDSMIGKKAGSTNADGSVNAYGFGMEGDMASRAAQGADNKLVAQGSQMDLTAKLKYGTNTKDGTDIQEKLRKSSAARNLYDNINKGKGGASGFYDDKGNLKSVESMNAMLGGMNESGVVGTGEDDKSRSIVMKLHREQLALVKEIQEIEDQPEQDAKKLEDLRSTQAIQVRMEKRAKAVQTAGIAQQATALTNAQNIASADKAGFNVANKTLSLKHQITQLADKENKIKVQIQAAELGAYAIIEKNVQARVGEGKTDQEKAEILEQNKQKEGETLAVYAARLNISDSELTNMMASAEAGGVQLLTQIDLNAVKERSLQLAKDLLVNQTAVTIAAQGQAKAALVASLAAASLARSQKTMFGAGKAKAKRAADKLANTNKSDANTNMITALDDQMGGITGNSSREGMGADDLYTDANLAGDIKYNALLTKRLKLQNDNAILAQKNFTIADKELGLHIIAASGALLETAQFKREQVFSLNPAVEQFNKLMLQAKAEEVELTQTTINLLIEEANATESLKIETELLGGIQSTLSSGFVSMFQAMVDGTKSFKESMKDLTASVLTDLAAMFAKAAALKILMAMFPGMGGMMTAIESIPGMSRYGGEQTGFRTGGVADGPGSGYMVEMHGREAVVPLGNDRSIPVELSGGGASGNTVNVSISMNGQGQGSSQVSGDGMQGLGRSIGNMVQQHLQQEMRPGGLLNQQGTKGRG